jgi:hypothetical protein
MSSEIITSVKFKEVFLDSCYNMSLRGDKSGLKYRRLLTALYYE